MKQLAILALLLAALPCMSRAETHTVTMEGMKFQPEVVRVKLGDEVVWKNADVVPHTATAAGRFDSGQVDTGKSWSWKPTAKGRIDYVCTYHPGMKAVVIVE